MSDLISRQDAIDALEKDEEYNKDIPIRAEGVRDAIITISTLPSAQQWIPCSERLPDEARHYLCSFEKPNRIDRIYVDLAYWTGGRWHGYVADAINAWMPLPEPYKDGDENGKND